MFLRAVDVSSLVSVKDIPAECDDQPFSLVDWELELGSGLVVRCLLAEHPIILAHKGRGTRQHNPMMKSWLFLLIENLKVKEYKKIEL